MHEKEGGLLFKRLRYFKVLNEEIREQHFVSIIGENLKFKIAIRNSNFFRISKAKAQ